MKRVGSVAEAFARRRQGKFLVASSPSEDISRNWSYLPELIGWAQGTDEHPVLRIPLSCFALVLIVSCAKAESGLASFYEGVGRSGEMTCAHRTRAFGSIVAVTYRGRTIRCRVNDRGPFKKGRVIDVSTSVARALGMLEAGVVLVSLQ